MNYDKFAESLIKMPTNYHTIYLSVYYILKAYVGKFLQQLLSMLKPRYSILSVVSARLTNPTRQ